MSNKAKYKNLCNQELNIPLFSQAWWLDLVCDEETWDVCLVEEGTSIVAAMPYCIKKRYSFTLIEMPKMTQTLGPWLRTFPPAIKYSSVIGKQKEYMNELLRKLPRYDYFHQNWHHTTTNWLPFYWNGYLQTTRYTYMIENLNDLDKVWEDFQSNIKTDIKKAQNKHQVRITESDDIETFIKLLKLTFNRQGKALPFSDQFATKLIRTVKQRDSGALFLAIDNEARVHAGVFIVWDANTTYYLMGGGDPNLRNSGATSLCLWHAIQFASKHSRSFDFEGSMMEPVEKFFRAFGAKQTSYFSIVKVISRTLKTAQFIKTLF